MGQYLLHSDTGTDGRTDGRKEEGMDMISLTADFPKLLFERA
jgi:hypothetical protein